MVLILVDANLTELFAGNRIKPKAHAESWFEYSRPIMEWLNPHETYDWDWYVETLIQNAMDVNANTIIPVSDITLEVKGMKKAKTLSGKELKTKYSNGYLTIQFPKLEVIEANLIQK